MNHNSGFTSRRGMNGAAGHKVLAHAALRGNADHHTQAAQGQQALSSPPQPLKGSCASCPDFVLN